MPLVPLYGHEAVRDRLARAADSGTLPASLLLIGPRGVGKQRLALWLAQRLLCAGEGDRPCGKCEHCRYSAELTHPDLHWVFPRERPKDESRLDETAARSDLRELVADRVKVNGLYQPTSGKEGIFVFMVRALVGLAAMTPALARRKVIVVGEADRMVSQAGSDQAANAFLKLLEEPPADTNIILTSSEPGALLPTIRSRVVQVRMAPLADAEVRRFVADPLVQARLRKLKIEGDTPTLVEHAAGLPGRALVPRESVARARAERMLEAATGNERAALVRTAYAQGVSGARGDFADALDELTILLHERLRRAASADKGERALATARAVDAVEHAKSLAAGNVHPQLVTVQLLDRLTTELAR